MKYYIVGFLSSSNFLLQKTSDLMKTNLIVLIFLVSHYSIVNYEGRQLLCQNKKDAPEYIKYDKQITLDTKDYGVTLLCNYATIKAYEPTTTTTTTTTRRPGYCQQGMPDLFIVVVRPYS